MFRPALGLLASLSLSVPLWAKAPTILIELKGAGLTTPIEITSREALNKYTFFGSGVGGISGPKDLSRATSGSVVVKTSFRDNPALSEELGLEIEHLKATDPDEYEYVFEGMCRQAVQGAVYKNELLAATKRDASALYRTMPASLLTPSGTWDTSIALRSGWLSLSVLSFGSSTSFRGNNRAFSIT